MLYSGNIPVKIQISDGARELLSALKAHGYDAYAVGGCVRDSLSGVTPHDWDICTSATPDEMREVFKSYRVIDTGSKHGTLTVLHGGKSYEITTFRVDGGYSDGRRPDNVSFTRRLEDDLSRRDFTINAMAADAGGSVVDLFGGRKDLAAGIIRCVGNAGTRFDEDALRILRALRFSAVLGFSFDPETEAAIFEKRENLRKVSGERILDELLRMLEGEFIEQVLLEFGEVLAVPIPEIAPCVNFEHRNRWHHLDVWAHICHAVALGPKDRRVRLALLMHDLAKPICAEDKENGHRRFHGHPAKSAELSEARLRALHAPKALITLVTNLVRLHDEDLLPKPSLAGRFLRELGDEGALLLCEVQLADARAHRLSHPPALERVRNVDATRALMKRLIAEEAPYLPSRLAVNGSDVASLNFEGAEIAHALEKLCDLALEGKVENEKEALLKTAKGFTRNK